MISPAIDAKKAQERVDLRWQLWKEYQISREITNKLNLVELQELIKKQKPTLF